DDPGRQTETMAVEASALAQAYIQLTEAEAGPLEAADSIERRDSYGRVPVLVRIRRQPPINPVWLLVAIGLAASGLFLPLVVALRAIIIVGAVVALVVGLLSRLFIRVPPGSVGLVTKAGRHSRVLPPGNQRVNPFVALSHLVTTREIAFDVPVNEVRSSDGVGVAVDVLLTLRIADPVKFAYAITPSDADQFVQASCQDAVRTLVRGIEAMSALDLGSTQSDALRQVIDPRLEAFGIDVSGVAFTRITLPTALTDSLEARRLASLQLAERAETFALDKRRLADAAALVAQEADARRASVEFEAVAEAVRLAKLEERIAANPNAAVYDVESARLRVAEKLAGNSRAVVSLGGGDLFTNLLLAREGDGDQAPPAAMPRASATEATPAENGGAPKA
ncbi:MAG: SPFH domain-containing protein, partial [Chloroflexi bacterium]|nr:SPFH domain-containing protein [Chloroflexota bacterium]